jgi:hypothetical protein
MDGSAGFVWDNEGPQQPPQQVTLVTTRAVLAAACCAVYAADIHHAVVGSCAQYTALCRLQVAAFLAAAGPVTIGEFYNFAVTARGYKCPELWQPEDHALFAGRGQVPAPTYIHIFMCTMHGVLIAWSIVLRFLDSWATQSQALCHTQLGRIQSNQALSVCICNHV